MAGKDLELKGMKSRRNHWVVVYKGDNAIAQGYARDVIKELNISFSTLSYMLSPAYKRRVDTPKHRPSGYTTVIDLDEKPEMPTPKRVARYYLTHSLEDTKAKFNIGQSTVCRYFRLVHGCSKNTYLKNAIQGTKSRKCLR